LRRDQPPHAGVKLTLGAALNALEHVMGYPCELESLH
jgi:hypothetical protein